MKSFLKRFGRNAAGLGIGVAVAYVPDLLGLVEIPAAIQPIVPFFVGPLVNAAAKTGRDMLEPGVAQKICKAL